MSKFEEMSVERVLDRYYEHYYQEFNELKRLCAKQSSLLSPISIVGPCPILPYSKFDNLRQHLNYALVCLPQTPSYSNLKNFASRMLSELQYEYNGLIALQEPAPVIPAVNVPAMTNPMLASYQSSPAPIITNTSQPAITVIADDKQEQASTQPNPALIAIDICDKLPIKVLDGEIYLHAGGYYRRVSEAQFNVIVDNLYKAETIKFKRSNIFQQVRDFAKNSSQIQVYDEMINATNGLVAFKNGYISIVDGRFHPIDCNLFFTSAINMIFEGQLHEFEEPVRFNKFVQEICQGDIGLFDRIYEAIAYTLVGPDTISGKKFFCCQGVTNSGKSTLLNIISSFFNKDLNISIGVNDLGGQFALSQLAGKRFVYDPETTSDHINANSVAKLKQLTGGDMISSDVKYKDRIIFKPNFVVWLAGNHPFMTTIKDTALQKRIVGLPFSRSIDRPNYNLAASFLPEHLNIVKKAIYQYYRPLANRDFKFSGQYEINSLWISSNVHDTQVLTMDDIIIDFIATMITFEPDCEVGSMDLYISYINYCEKRGVAPATQKKFSELINNSFCQNNVTKDRKRLNGSKNPVAIYIGLKVKPLDVQ